MTIIINVCMQLGIHFTSTTKPPFSTTMTSSYSNIYPSQTCTCMTTTMFSSQICTTYYTNLASTGEPDCITPVAMSVSVVFILTATLSSVLTLILTILCIKMRSRRPKPAGTQPDSGPTHPAEQVERHQQSKVVVYDEIATQDHSVPLTNNPAYGTH